MFRYLLKMPIWDFKPSEICYNELRKTDSSFSVPDATWLYIRGWMQMVYCHMIYSPEPKQNNQQDIWILWHGTLLLLTYRVAIIHRNYVLSAWWVLFVAPDSSSRLPGCSMKVLPPPLLLNYCLSCSPPGGPDPPHSPLLGWPHFPQGPGTFQLLRWTQLGRCPWFSIVFSQGLRNSYIFNLKFVCM